MTDTQTFHTGYMDDALFHPEKIIEQAKVDLADVDYDTLVGTGFSGGIIIPMLAAALGKSFCLVRKESDTSHHGAGRLMGRLGKRWLFVDDFVGSGATKNYVMEKVSTTMVTNFETYDYEPIGTTYVGDYLYVPAQWEDQDGFKPAVVAEQSSIEVTEILDLLKPSYA